MSEHVYHQCEFLDSFTRNLVVGHQTTTSFQRPELRCQGRRDQAPGSQVFGSLGAAGWANPLLHLTTARRRLDEGRAIYPPQPRHRGLGAGGSAPTADDDCRCSCLTATATPAGCARGRREQLVWRAALAEGTAGSSTAERLHFDAAKDGRREQAPLGPRCWACANCRRGRDCPT